MEAKIGALEFRNKEFEKTMLKIHEIIDSLNVNHVYPAKKETTHKKTGSSQPNLLNSKSRYDDLLQGIHDGVSANLMLIVEK